MVVHKLSTSQSYHSLQTFPQLYLNLFLILLVVSLFFNLILRKLFASRSKNMSLHTSTKVVVYIGGTLVSFLGDSRRQIFLATVSI